MLQLEPIIMKYHKKSCFTICFAALASNHEQLTPIIKLSDDSKVKEGQASCYSLLSINEFHTFSVLFLELINLIGLLHFTFFMLVFVKTMMLTFDMT